MVVVEGQWRGIASLKARMVLLCSDHCQQLNHPKSNPKAIIQKPPALANTRGIVFDQDDARPHTYIVTRQKVKVCEELTSIVACENRLSYFAAIKARVSLRNLSDLWGADIWVDGKLTMQSAWENCSLWGTTIWRNDLS